MFVLIPSIHWLIFSLKSRMSRYSLDPEWLWLWCRLTAVALIQSLPGNFRMPRVRPEKAKKKKKKKKKKRKEKVTCLLKRKKYIFILTHLFTVSTT